MTGPADEGPDRYDVVVVGSGFGGSTAALRLTEKGYRVAVLEAGRRFADDELPRTSWDARRYLWAPWLGLFGIQRFHLPPGVLVVAGAGVGGGSLNYANTLYQPPAGYFGSGPWAGITDWQDELAPHYDQATRMLGVTTNPSTAPADEVILEVARQLGVESTYRPTPVGVLRMRAAGVLPGQSDRRGHLTRTNSEAVLAGSPRRKSRCGQVSLSRYRQTCLFLLSPAAKS